MLGVDPLRRVQGEWGASHCSEWFRALAGCCGVLRLIREGGGSVRRVRALQAVEGCFGRLQG